MKQEPKPGQWVFAYEKYVQWIAGEAATWETLVRETLMIRDDLAAMWSELSAIQRQRVIDVDGQLIQCSRQLRKCLPDQRDHPNAHWWWHLHKGPQVRELAGRTAA